jgi:amino acid transporter
MNRQNKKKTIIYFIAGLIIAALIIIALNESKVKELNEEIPFLKIIFIVTFIIGYLAFLSRKNIKTRRIMAVIDLIVGLYFIMRFGYDVFERSLTEVSFSTYIFLLMGVILALFGIRDLKHDKKTLYK